MAYKTEELEEHALKMIKENLITNILDLSTYMPCSRETMYQHNLHKADTIKGAINDNRVLMKAGLRKKMYESENSSDRIALYKILGNQDERDALNGARRVHEGELTANVQLPTKLPMQIQVIGYEHLEDNGEDE